MSARNRARANPNQDADEERRLWKEIKDKAKDVDVMVVCSNPLHLLVCEVYLCMLLCCANNQRLVPTTLVMRFSRQKLNKPPCWMQINQAILCSTSY